MKTASLDPALWHASASGHTHARGCVFLPDGTMLADSGLANYLDEAADAGAWHERVKALNGLFSAVRTSPDFSAAAVDPSRAYPLFFRKGGGETLIADSLDALLREGDKMSDDAALEYDRTGAPFNGKTLVEGIRQVRPGVSLFADGSERAFYTYLARPEEIATRTDDEFMAVMERVIGRLIESVGDRQIVLPLSGGQDSRLIACMLKRLGAKNVLCYTAGRPGNCESAVSGLVAAQIGFEWHEVDTTSAEAMALVGTARPEFVRYVDYVGQGVNFVWLYDYVCLQLMRERGWLYADAVIVPGYSADFQAGSQLRKACVGRRSSVGGMASGFLYAIFEYDSRGLRKRVESAIGRWVGEGYEPWTSFQQFMFTNKLPYNINNSTRAYEFFGYGLALPYWDRQFLDFFRTMDYAQLDDCSFYNNFVRNRVFAPMGVNFATVDKPKSFWRKNLLKKRVKSLIPGRLLPASPRDPVGEFELTRGMAAELGSEYRQASANEVMKDWYIAHLSKKLVK